MQPLLTIRPAIPEDAEALRQIYNHAARTSTATMDIEGRTTEQQQAWMRSHNGDTYPLLVAVIPDGQGLTTETSRVGGIIGYATLSSYNSKPGYSRTAETSVYVREDCQGYGVGRALLSTLLSEAKARYFLCLVALITADNEASLRLHLRCGFTDVGTLRRVGEKFGQEVDVTFMQILLDEEG